MLSKIKVYGRLARFLGERTFEAEVKTPIDTFKFLLANFPQLERHMIEQNYCVKVGKNEIDETELFNPIGQQEIKIVPVATGSRGIGRVLAGVALVGLAFAMPGAIFQGFGGFKAAAGFSGFQAAVGNLGIALTLMGVSEMLFPLPKPPDFSNEEDPRISFSFSGVQNTSRAGTSHPIAYGEIVTGSVVISAGIDTNQVQA